MKILALKLSLGIRYQQQSDPLSLIVEVSSYSLRLHLNRQLVVLEEGHSIEACCRIQVSRIEFD
ncbi:MAG TPA: hypothetical protein VE504_07070 [Nitrososphaeraceae archaeon]|nr:hypothetical protein [Nitrososphaeraceae archaeon]